MCEKVGNMVLVSVWMTYWILVLFIEHRKCARDVHQRHIFRHTKNDNIENSLSGAGFNGGFQKSLVLLPPQDDFVNWRDVRHA